MLYKESLLQTQEIQTVGAKGHSSMVSASRAQQDNLHVDLEEAEKPYKLAPVLGAFRAFVAVFGPLRGP